MSMKIDVHHVATLANLSLSDQESKQFEKQLADVLTYIERLNEVDVTGVESTSQVTGLENITREDTVTPSLTQAEALSNASAQQNSLFQVKGILPTE